MSVAVLIADPDAGGPGAMARVGQSIDLWRRLGLAVDLVLLSQPERRAVPPVDAVAVRRLACLPAGIATGDGAALERLLLRMNDGAPHAAAHVLHADIAPRRRAAPVWIAEPAAAAPGVAADLFLARCESQRAALSSSGHPAVRLPVAPLPPGPAVRGKAIGWIGDWSAERAAAWSEALARLSRHGADLSGGIVLMGPGSQDVRIPDNMVQWACSGPGSGHVSVLGLAAAPGPVLRSDQVAVARALALGVPVLLGRAGAAFHEDRWHLPVIDGADSLCDLVRARIAGALDLSAALAATVRAFDRDLAAMTEHVLDEIAALVPSASRPRRKPAVTPPRTPASR